MHADTPHSTDPWLGNVDETTVRASPSMSLSLPTTLTEIGATPIVEPVSSTATGPSLTGVTTIDTVAEGDDTVPSSTVKVKLSGPK